MNQVVHLAPVPRRTSANTKALAQPRAATNKRAPVRTNDPARTMAGILEVAMAEFAEKGLDGGRIDAIAATTRTSKRMIYYYFGSKEGLYLAVLEESYRRMRAIEADLRLEDLAPEDALRRLVGFTFDHHYGNQAYIRLVMSENIQRGSYLAQSKTIQQLNVPAIEAIQKLYERGLQQGVFRVGLEPVDLHASISALTFFNVSNQHTFGLIFKRDMRARQTQMGRRDSIIDMVVRFVRK
ncbi:MAG: TetR family transcriptional regulator [Rhodoferax sp.]|nr:TetR family transcriptional regulator [Rhodoferax sp.]